MEHLINQYQSPLNPQVWTSENSKEGERERERERKKERERERESRTEQRDGKWSTLCTYS